MHARRLEPSQRKQLAMRAIDRDQSISALSDQYRVSRKFIYQQQDKAMTAIDQVFRKPKQTPRPIFYLPITKPWIDQVILCLSLNCGASSRAIVKTFKDVFDYSVSTGHVHNVLQAAIAAVAQIPDGGASEKVRVATHDELFHLGGPVFVGLDADSLYCHLLESVEKRDCETWSGNLRRLKEQGFNPQYIISDYARGHREACQTVLPEVPHHGDYFHMCHQMQQALNYFANRVKGYKTYRPTRNRQKGISELEQKEKHAFFLEVYQDLETLITWLKYDVLAIAGTDAASREMLYDFIVEELEKLEKRHPHRIRKVRVSLQDQKPEMLAFVFRMDMFYEQIAREHEISKEQVDKIAENERFGPQTPRYLVGKMASLISIGKEYQQVWKKVCDIQSMTVRSSSAAENLNSRLRRFFNDRRQIEYGYLKLLRFYLNHTPFMRSRRPERVGKSPKELLMGPKHPHWLEMLGYQRFQRSA